jgi:catechol 2,3-dioxygenase-like lactoylglutathione lyase family enzyme
MSRVQLALNVNDIDEAVSFYTKLFGTEPAKRRPGYANFAITQPPLKLVLLENPGQGGTLNHLGVEVDSTDAVDAEQARLAEAGLAAVDERDTTCCYARQDKFWVTGTPGGERWEIYTVLADSQTFWGQDGSQSWDAVETELDGAPGTGTGAQTARCCGDPQAAGDDEPAACCACSGGASWAEAGAGAATGRGRSAGSC